MSPQYSRLPTSEDSPHYSANFFAKLCRFASFLIFGGAILVICEAWAYTHSDWPAERVKVLPLTWQEWMGIAPSYRNATDDQSWSSSSPLSEELGSLALMNSSSTNISLDAVASTTVRPETKTAAVKQPSPSRPLLISPNLPNQYLFGDYYDYLLPASDQQYVTAIPLGGISNQMVSVFNLLVLANRTSRAPILPPILPSSHQLDHRRGPSYSTFYNVSALSTVLGLPVLDWNELRASAPHRLDGSEWAWAEQGWKNASQPLQCWVAAKMGGKKADGGRDFPQEFGKGLWLDIKTLYGPGDKTNGAWNDLRTAERMMGTNGSTAAVGRGKDVEKDLACLTETYWLKGATSLMNEMTKFLRFNHEVEALVDETLADALSIPVHSIRDASFITVHLRRNDVFNKCFSPPKNWQSLEPALSKDRRDVSHDVYTRNGDLDAAEDLPAPIKAHRIYNRGGKAPWQHCYFTNEHIIATVESFRLSFGNISVILATDDTNPASLAIFDAQPGWHRLVPVDMKASKGEFGDFWGTMRDTAVLTRGKGFVGAKVSTFSRLAADRGRLWYGRPAKWF